MMKSKIVDKIRLFFRCYKEPTNHRSRDKKIEHSLAKTLYCRSDFSFQEAIKTDVIRSPALQTTKKSN